MSAIEHATAIRLRLHAAGYFPIPTNGKKPVLDEWPERTKTGPEHIAAWAREYPFATNTGVLTARMPAFDGDILNPEASAAVKDLVRARFGDCGHFLERVGLPPKRAFPFQTAKPFKKIQCVLIGPSGDKGEKIEFLGDGQQIVVDGVHPDTRKPYAWFGGEPGAVRLDELPCISEAEARKLVLDAVELLVAEHGYRVKSDEREKDAAGEPKHLLALELARKVWGEPTSQKGTEYRFGTNGSKSLDLSTGVWFDFERTGGGGMLDLARLASKVGKPAETPRRLLQTSAEFIGDFVPPDYLIKGLVQHRFLYSMTAPTGAGKTCIAMRIAAHVAFGLPLAGRRVKQGKVLFMAGENPDDVRMRWIKLSEEMQIDPDTDQVIWRAGSLALSDEELRRRIDAEAGQVALGHRRHLRGLFRGRRGEQQRAAW